MNCSALPRLASVLLLVFAGAVWGQISPDEPDWKESEAPPPPAFDTGKLVTFDVSPASSLVYGVDPASISISRTDGLVRYVMVATSASGVRNVLYEGLRCATGEYKTYGRYSPEGRWSMVSEPAWQSLFGSRAAQRTLQFAKAGACDNAAQPLSVAALVSRLRASASSSLTVR